MHVRLCPHMAAWVVKMRVQFGHGKSPSADIAAVTLEERGLGRRGGGGGGR